MSEKAAAAPLRVAALVLAAGRSTRTPGVNKLLRPLGGLPMIARVADAALASGASETWVVLGHQAERVRAALSGRALSFAHNADFEQGLSSSLRVGLAAVAGRCAGCVVCLGDMPGVRADHIAALIAAFAASGGREVCVPVYEGRRGNPVLWPSSCFPALQALSGDAGGRVLLERGGLPVRRVPMPDDGVLADADTSAALDALRRRFG